MKNVDSWWKQILKFFTPLPREKSKAAIQKEIYEKAWKESAVVLKKYDTPKPKKDKKPAAKKTKVTRIKKKK